MPITIDDTVLPEDTLWVDEFDWSAVSTAQSYSLGGRLRIQHFKNRQGRLMTLSSLWISREALMELTDKRDIPGRVYTASLVDGRTFKVKFNHLASPVVRAVPIIPKPDYLNSVETSKFDTTLNFIMV